MVQPCSTPTDWQCLCPALQDVHGPHPVAGPSWEQGCWELCGPRDMGPCQGRRAVGTTGLVLPPCCLRLSWWRGRDAHLPSDVLLEEMGSSSPALSEPFLVLQDVLWGSTCGEPVELGLAAAAFFLGDAPSHQFGTMCRKLL